MKWKIDCKVRAYIRDSFFVEKQKREDEGRVIVILRQGFHIERNLEHMEQEHMDSQKELYYIGQARGKITSRC